MSYLPINGLLDGVGHDFALVGREEFVGEEGLPVFGLDARDMSKETEYGGKGDLLMTHTTVRSNLVILAS